MKRRTRVLIDLDDPYAAADQVAQAVGGRAIAVAYLVEILEALNGPRRSR